MKVNVSNLKHHPQNKDIYSLSDIEDLMDSIQEVGLLNPLVINQDNQVISGNRRFLAISNLGWKTVEVQKVKVSPEEVGNLLVHHNKFRRKTFREILNEYRVLEKHYKKKSGRKKNGVLKNKNNGKSRDQISDILNIGSSQIGKLLVIQKFDDELIDLIDQEILTVSQAYLQVSRIKKERESRESTNENTEKSSNSKNFRFYQKCSSSMDELETGEVQMVFTSPPYFNKRTYSDEGGLGNEKSSGEYVENLISHLDDTFRVLNEKGSLFLNLGDTFENGNLKNIPHKVVIGLQERKGWILRNSIIWSKTNPKPSSSKSNLCPTYEFIFHLVKSQDYYYSLTLSSLKDKTKPSHSPRHRVSDGESKVSTMSPYIPSVSGKNMGDYWNEDIVRTSVANQFKSTGTEHPAPFPEQIVLLPVLQTTKEGDLVLAAECRPLAKTVSFVVVQKLN